MPLSLRLIFTFPFPSSGASMQKAGRENLEIALAQS